VFTGGDRVKTEECSHNWLALLEKCCTTWSLSISRGRGWWQQWNCLAIWKNT